METSASDPQGISTEGTTATSENHVSEAMKQTVKMKSSVDYTTCCGIGHRMSKMVDAYYHSIIRNFGLRIFWGFCTTTMDMNNNNINNITKNNPNNNHSTVTTTTTTIEIFHYFFGSQPLEEIKSVTNMSWVMKVKNESPCFHRLHRTGIGNETTMNEREDGDDKNKNNNIKNQNQNQNQTCPCPAHFLEASETFYIGLLERFTERKSVQEFQQKHDFETHFVLGLHIRAGNGEQGDFVRKQRGIPNITEWVHHMTQTILSLSTESTRHRRVTTIDNEGQQQQQELPPILFIATDTASLVTDFRESLKGKIKVIDYHQERLQEGEGVIFGEMGRTVPQLASNECLSHWRNPLMDMMILASADVVIAGRPSSFTQSLPMSIALSRRRRPPEWPKKKALRPYCEVSLDGQTYQCFQDSYDWCCHGRTDFYLNGTRRYEFRRMPHPDFQKECGHDHDQKYLIRRPSDGGRIPTIQNSQAISSFLPYNWDWVNY